MTSKSTNIRPPRISPRRLHQVTPAGIKRIVLTPMPKNVVQAETKPSRTPEHPQHCFLVIAHSNNRVLDDHARQAIAAAAILADENTRVIACILGALDEDLADAGADQVIVMPALNFEYFQPDVELASIHHVIATTKPDRILMPDNQIGDGDLGRRLIATMQKSAATQVIEINANHVATRQTGGSQFAQCALPEIILLAPDAVDTQLPFIAAAQPCNPAEVTQAADSRYLNLGMQTMVAGQVALEEADFIISAGNGVQHVDTFKVLAEALDAAIGASRVAVDDGKFSRDKQIGASGKTVSASTYLAIGISGAVQHLQGIKDCRHVIAINRDSSAPIIQRANLSLIGDAQDLMQALITEIVKAKAMIQEAK